MYDFLLGMSCRPDDHPESSRQLKIVDPEGGAQEVRRFSTRQDAASKNPRNVTDGRFASALSVFFGYFLCDKESNPRKARKLCSCFLD